jgi:hypothetical protein
MPFPDIKSGTLKPSRTKEACHGYRTIIRRLLAFVSNGMDAPLFVVVGVTPPALAHSMPFHWGVHPIAHVAEEI